MKIMNVSFSIDVCNIEHVKALENFTRALGGHPYETVVTAIPFKGIKVEESKKAVEEEEEEETPAVDKEKTARAARAAARKAKAEAEAKMAEEEEEEDEEEEAEDLVGEEEEEEIDISTLRTLTAEKIKADDDNKALISARLKKYGAKNVTSIPEEKFQDYFNFISKL